MTFGEAVEALKQGKRVKRSIWGGYWFLMNAAQVSEEDELGYEKMATLLPTIFAVLKDGQGVTVAQPYQNDILAEDWEIVQ